MPSTLSLVKVCGGSAPILLDWLEVCFNGHGELDGGTSYPTMGANWTKGLERRPFMYNTVRELEQICVSVAKEVFGRDLHRKRFFQHLASALRAEYEPISFMESML
jgi:hypothetical protein